MQLRFHQIARKFLAAPPDKSPDMGTNKSSHIKEAMLNNNEVALHFAANEPKQHRMDHNAWTMRDQAWNL